MAGLESAALPDHNSTKERSRGEAISHTLDNFYQVTHFARDTQHSFGRGVHWFHESPFLPVGWETTNAVGAGSLKHAAMLALMSDQSLLRSEIFENVPWLIAKYLWENMYRCKKRTLWLWKLLVINYPEFCQHAPSYQLIACKLNHPLTQYFEAISNNDCKWGAILTVTPNITDVQNLVAIANIKNLVALEISTDQRVHGYSEARDEHEGDLQDSVVRSWMEMAQNGHLRHLRIIRFANQHKITPNILWMLEKLTALELIVIHDCPNVMHNKRKNTPLRNVQHEGFRMNGWIGRSLDQDPSDSLPKGALQPLGSLLAVCRAGMNEDPESLSPDHLLNLTTVDAQPPLLSFELLGSDRSTSWFSPGTEQRSIFVLRRDNKANAKKRQPEADAAPGHPRMRKKKGGRDLSDFLGDFL